MKWDNFDPFCRFLESFENMLQSIFIMFIYIFNISNFDRNFEVTLIAATA